jgi:hypothetical protein
MPFDLKNYFIFSPYFANTENLSENEVKSIGDKADRLPPEVIEHLMSTDVATAIKNTITKYNITEKQAIIISVLVRRVYLKDSAKASLSSDIVKYANISPQKVRDLVQYLEEGIFARTPEASVRTTPEEPKPKENVINLKQE